MRLATLFLLGVTLQCAPVYTITSLGTFGGGINAAFAISQSGQAVGNAQTLNGTDVAFTSTGNPTILQTQANAQDINGMGAIAGTAYGSSGPRATIWENGIARQVLEFDSYGLGINEGGDIAGSMVVASQAVAFVSSGDQLTAIETPGNWSAAYDISDNGQAVGYYQKPNGRFQAFSWTQDGGTVSLGTLGGRNSYAQAVNNHGQIVGSSAVRSGYLHAFLYDGIMQDLGTLGGAFSAAYDINDNREAVGLSVNSIGQDRAFIWKNGNMFDLNSLIDPESGWALESAYGINRQGQIVGAGTYNGQSTAFRLDPDEILALTNPGGATAFDVQTSAASVPEPSTLASLAISVLLLGLYRKLRRIR